MRGLLDVNVLIALLNAGHVHHTAAHAWLGEHIANGWASCPLTQIGCLRILTADRYPRLWPVGAVAARLAEAVATPHHAFWMDAIPVLDAGRESPPSRVDLNQAHDPSAGTRGHGISAIWAERSGSK
jgi:predicted nucleic acid-binding protein